MSHRNPNSYPAWCRMAGSETWHVPNPLPRTSQRVVCWSGNAMVVSPMQDGCPIYCSFPGQYWYTWYTNTRTWHGFHSTSDFSEVWPTMMGNHVLQVGIIPYNGKACRKSHLPATSVGSESSTMTKRRSKALSLSKLGTASFNGLSVAILMWQNMCLFPESALFLWCKLEKW